MKKVTIIILILSIFLISGCSEEENIEKQGKLTGQVIKEDVTEKNTCPKQGVLQSDLSYCVDLCLLDKSDATIHEELCGKMCDQAEYLKGTEGLQKKIQSYKCKKCGECTEEQLKEIEEKRIKDEEVARIQNIREECREKCRNEAVSQLSEGECYPNGRDGYTPDECSRIIVNCIQLEECNTLNGSEEQLKAIEEKKKQIGDEQRKEEQEKLELEKNIESQSEKWNGYVYIKNKSGASRQFNENGIIYEFPYPADDPTKVPTDLGKRLLATGQFELVII